MLGRVARLHYQHGLTHQQIADTLGLSRVKVTRLLAEARRSGVVEIRVHSDETIFTDLEFELQAASGLDQVWVAPSFEEIDRLRRSIGTVGAEALQAALRPQTTVAVGLSETVAQIPPHAQLDEPSGAVFVPATGSRLGHRDRAHPHEVVQELARAFQGDARHLPAPVLTATAESARLLRAEPDVAATLSLARAADLAVFGVGGMAPGTGLLMDGMLPDGTVRTLVDDGAVGGISAGFFDAAGQPVATELSERIIGLTLAELRAIPVRLAMAGGPDKRAALAGALAGGYLTRLVTDEATARSLLERFRQPWSARS